MRKVFDRKLRKFNNTFTLKYKCNQTKTKITKTKLKTKIKTKITAICD